MLSTSRCRNSQIHGGRLTQLSVPVVLLWLILPAISLAAPGTAANSADDAAAASGARPAVDIIDRLSRKHAAAQRVEELDQESWKAISKEGDVARAIMSMSHAAELARSEFGGEHWLTVVKESLAAGLKSLDELPPARRQLYVEASKAQAFAVFQWSQGNKERALSLLRQAQDKRTQGLGANHILSANFLMGLAFHECDVNDFREAKRHSEEAAEILKVAWGEKSPGWANALYYEALAERGLHDLEPAEKHFREAIEILEPVAREGISEFFLMMYSDAQLHVARLLNDRGRYADAEPFARRGSDILAFASRQVLGRFLESQVDLARSVSGQERFTEADVLFACLFKSLPQNPPPDALARIFTCYAEHLRRAHRDDDAKQLQSRIQKLSAQIAKPKSDDDYGLEIAPSAGAPAATRKK